MKADTAKFCLFFYGNQNNAFGQNSDYSLNYRECRKASLPLAESYRSISTGWTFESYPRFYVENYKIY